ncbi:type IV pilus biogenesis protein PilP [Citrobacter koseri]|uniref:type IV pilus biogenesis protein PilP n=1 Tax=Citrobacter koseri TaxID=545 RepID=UPI003892C6DB
MYRNKTCRWLLCGLTMVLAGQACAAQDSTTAPAADVTAAQGHTAAPATDASAAADSLTILQFEDVIQDNLLLEQQVQRARLQRQLQENSGSSEPAVTAAPIYGTAPGMAGQPVVQESKPAPAVPARPRLQDIWGRPGDLRARVRLPHGGIVEVRKGDRLPGEKQTVSAITPDVVRLSDGSELTF